VQVQVSVHNSYCQPGAFVYQKEKKSKEYFAQKNMKQRKATFKDLFHIAATTCEVSTSRHHCLQHPIGKLKTRNGEAREGKHPE